MRQLIIVLSLLMSVTSYANETVIVTIPEAKYAFNVMSVTVNIPEIKESVSDYDRCVSDHVIEGWNVEEAKAICDETFYKYGR